jgi:hypothetical protein
MSSPSSTTVPEQRSIPDSPGPEEISRLSAYLVAEATGTGRLTLDQDLINDLSVTLDGMTRDELAVFAAEFLTELNRHPDPKPVPPRSHDEWCCPEPCPHTPKDAR